MAHHVTRDRMFISIQAGLVTGHFASGLPPGFQQRLLHLGILSIASPLVLHSESSPVSQAEMVPYTVGIEMSFHQLLFARYQCSLHAFSPSRP
jgi:hypothetical protein